MFEIVPWSADAAERCLGRCPEAEGLPMWYSALAATTLALGERAVLVRWETATLPLVLGPHGTRALTAPYTTRYSPALRDAAAAYELGRQVRRFADGVLRLDAIEGTDAGMAAFLGGVAEAGMAVASYRGFANWSEEVADFESYWRQRPSRLRSTVKRKLGAADFTLYRDGFEPALTSYEDIRSASWKSPEPHPDFLPAMVRGLAPAGAVRMGVLTIGGRAVAAQLWLMHGGRGTIFKLVHREDAAAASPGTILTYRMIEAACRDGLKVLDFGRGDDIYKRDWTRTRVTRLGVIAADWRKGKGVKSLAAEVLPTLAMHAWRRHFPVNRNGSVAAGLNNPLASGRGKGTVATAEALR